MARVGTLLGHSARRSRLHGLAAGLALLVLGPASALGAQAGGVAALTGKVRDGAGAPLAAVRITVLAPRAEAAITTTVTTAGGTFRLTQLPAGRYRIRAEKAGFAAQTEARTLTPGATVRLDFVLTAVASAAAGALSTPTVENTPLNGRDWTQLAALRPGVSGVETENSSQGHTAQRGFGAALSISGARPEENDYVLDGISISDYSNGAPGSVVGATLGVDAVQRLTVLDNNYPASIGRTGGGLISAVTRSGGDTWHGDLYEFLRNSALDSRNFFDAVRPPFRRNQFGIALGGPVFKPGIFAFVDYEGLRQSLGITHVDTVPSAAARAGHLVSGNVTVDPAVARFLQALYPLPNGPLLGGGDTGIYSFAGQQATGENYVTGRLDWKRHAATLSATYLFDTSQVNQPDAFNDLIANVISRRQMLALASVHRLGADGSNSVRFGFNRARAVDGGLTRVLNAAVTDMAWSMAPSQFVGSIAVPGLTSFSGGPKAGSEYTNSSKTFAWNSFQGFDDLAWTRGSQTLQFGVVVERMQSNVGIDADTNGNFTFGSLSAFLQNQPLTFAAPSPLPVAVFGTRQTLFGAYAQDAVQLQPRLRLSLGLRYEITTVPTEAHNRIANLRHLTDAVAHLGSPYFLNPTLHDFEPRLGLSWQPFAATVARAGFGIFDALPLPYEFNIITPEAYPYFQQSFGTTLPAGTFPTAAYGLITANAANFRTSYVEFRPHRNYVMQWNASLERQLSSALALTAGYVGSRSVHLPLRTDDFNTVLPTHTPAGYLYPPAAASQRLNPYFGRISGITWNADGYYDALEASLDEAMRRGVQVQISYTWGKSIDTGTSSITSDQYDNSLVNMPVFDTRLDRGRSDLDLSQTLVANFTWQVPGPRQPHGLAWAWAGWQIGGVYKAQSGSPFTAELGGDPLGTKLTDVSAVPNAISGPGCGQRINPGDPNHYIKTQCFAFPSPARLRGDLGRNTLTGPGLSNVDFSLIKTIAFLQFRAEFFNLFNRADFAAPLDHLALFDAAGAPIQGAGLITSTVQPAREIQLAVKLLF